MDFRSTTECPHCGATLKARTTRLAGRTLFCGYEQCGCAGAEAEREKERQVEAEAAGRDGVHLHGGVIAQLHDGALAELLFDLGQRSCQRILLCARLRLLGGGGDVVVLILCHSVLLLYHMACGVQAVLYRFFPL